LSPIDYDRHIPRPAERSHRGFTLESVLKPSVGSETSLFSNVEVAHNRVAGWVLSRTAWIQRHRRPIAMRRFLCWLGLGAFLFIPAGCGNSADPPKRDKVPIEAPKAATATDSSETIESEHLMGVQKEPFGETADGTKLIQYLLANSNGMTVQIINLGAIVTAVNVPDRNGDPANVTLSFNNPEEYLDNSPHFGAICGRYANRIAKGKFTLGGTEYTLATNNGPNHLHGGVQGFGKAVWHAEPTESEDGSSVGVTLNLESPDGEEGYPGTLKTTVVYTLTNDNELIIRYSAVSDKATVLNLTNHCYWNLAGQGDVLGHVLTLDCDTYLPVDATMIPTGEIGDVKGSAMDFTQPMAIGSRLDQISGGYDHCYIINGESGELRLAARVVEPESGRVMEVLTTEPGVQLYTGNFLDGSDGTGGFAKHHAFCLECQHYPDSPNQPEFPTTVLEPGQVYEQTTVHRFSIEKK